jgi:hypothetical protein
MDLTGWRRQWLTTGGERFVADFKRLRGKSVYLEDLDGEIITKPLATLSDLDQHYVRDRSGGDAAPDRSLLREKVTRIIDGDTFELLVDGRRRVRIRLEVLSAHALVTQLACA